jgi:RNA polymerase primary sigma factor
MMKKIQHEAQNDNILQTYFNQIKAIPLLSFEEELALSKRIEAGDAEARRRLIESNLRLVVKIARIYLTPDVSIMDIIQEGNMGLIHAAGKYSYTKNVRFSTYANWWIRQSITRYLSNKRRAIRLPHRKEEILKKMQRAYHVLSQILHRKPSGEEIAAEVGVSQEEVDLILNMTNGMVSLEMETGEDSTVVDLHADYTYSPERALMKKVSRNDTIRFLDRLKDKEKRILMYRYQLNGGERYTLKRISAKMGISPETVRQIEMRALQKIRENADELKHCVAAM